MNADRRFLLRAGAALAALSALPRALFAAAWPARAFAATDAGAAMIELFGTSTPAESDRIMFKMPGYAENGAVVPVTIGTTLDDVRSISIIVAGNPRPLAALFEIPEGTFPEVSCRIKVAETSAVTAVVRTGSGAFSTTRKVRVTIGGCA